MQEFPRDIVEYICEYLFQGYLWPYSLDINIWQGLRDIRNFGFTSKRLWEFCETKMRKLCHHIPFQRFPGIDNRLLQHLYNIYPDWRCIILFKNIHFPYSFTLSFFIEKLGFASVENLPFAPYMFYDGTVWKNHYTGESVKEIIRSLTFDQKRLNRVINIQIQKNSNRFRRLNKRKRLKKRKRDLIK